jgi:hypothetical protein
LFTRQFLPGYFHSPLPGLDRFSPQGFAMLQTTKERRTKPFTLFTQKGLWLFRPHYSELSFYLLAIRKFNAVASFALLVQIELAKHYCGLNRLAAG